MARTMQQVRSPERDSSADLFDPMLAFLAVGPHMINRSRIASQRSVSYRNFRVGATLLGQMPGGDLRLWSDGNLKLGPDIPKRCAEKSVLDQARQAGCIRVLGITVVGTTDIDKIQAVSDLPTPTLHPCEPCRDMLRDDELVPDDALIVSSGLETDLLELHALEQLLGLYDSEAAFASPAAVEDPGFAGWRERTRLYPALTSETGQDGRLAAARFVITGQMPGDPV